MKLKRNQESNGVALFILLVSIVIMSLLIRQLTSSASNQATRVRNSFDRVQALYLARSSQNMARIAIYLDRTIESLMKKSADPADTLQDLWATPRHFPIAKEEIVAIAQSMKSQEENADPNAPLDPELLKSCDDFFNDFPGDAVSMTTDLSGRFNLKDLEDGSGLPLLVLADLLKPNIDFIRHLEDIGTNPESLAQEILDYIDKNDVDKSNSPETFPYTSANLDYGPKNLPFTNLDELKLIPHVDQVVFNFLSDKVSAYWIPTHTKSQINLNTVSKEVFQALLKGISDAEQVAENFIKDRTENKRVYTSKNLEQELSSALRLTKGEIQTALLTGLSDSFKIETTATVNKIEIKLETVVARPQNLKKIEPIHSTRIVP